VVRKATAQDVADLAGVSRSAVSLVLNGRAQGHIARDKQQAIIDAARRLKLHPERGGAQSAQSAQPYDRRADVAWR
jgi:DNA-binding LacI/PurR family transcriptional regulator